MFRIGIGKDSHLFDKAKEGEFLLGGVSFEGHPFNAHSDGDVVYHSVFNAISSALGKRSIGYYFPNTSERERGRDSSNYIKEALLWMHESGLRVVSLSIAIECQFPKIEPTVDNMKENLSFLLELPKECIGITATSGEGATPWGRGEGVEVISVVLLSK
ncbi:MAG: 2-C-methyl-D-erythritol 2,4-cyclodiphosphate synthase [Candidatus Dadabacteria bacterium]|nr:MAG: 2-C-methyl-D-erythritol 2,4-cyclodiphosphate synthase [Candidatus Dadabacteria bacterium]